MLIGPPVARMTSSSRLELPPMLVEMFAQPAMQRSELSLCNLKRNIRMSFDRGGIELRAENIADGVALKSATDGAAIPMHVLQTAIAVVARSNAEIGLHAGAPSFGEILDAEMAFEQFQLQVETHHDMQIIGDLVGIRADQGAFNLVDRAVKGLEPCLPELIWKTIPQNRVKMLPERAAAADDIFPKPRLALVHARGCSRS